MNKFMGVDLIQSLEAVLHQNTGFLPLWQKSHTMMRKKFWETCMNWILGSTVSM